jgi:hypothetical protein
VLHSRYIWFPTTPNEYINQQTHKIQILFQASNFASTSTNRPTRYRYHVWPAFWCVLHYAQGILNHVFQYYWTEHQEHVSVKVTLP